MNVGDPIPLYFQLFDYNNYKFVQAFVRNSTGSQIAGSPLLLTLVGNGLYGGTLPFPTESTFVTAQYIVYDNSELTSPSTSEGGGLEKFFVTQQLPSTINLPPYVPMIGYLESTLPQCPLSNGIEDILVINSDRVLTIRIVQDPNGLPFDLTGFTNIQVKLLNADSSILTISYTDLSTPIVVANPAAGLFTCVVSAAQSALLMPQNPAPFSVAITQPVGVTIVNFPTQLQIQEESV